MRKILTNFIRDWLKEIVVLFIIISMVDLIMPKGKMRKFVDFIIGILIVFTVISPFTKLNRISLDLDREVSNFENKIVNEESLLREQNKQIEDLYKKNINSEVTKLIEENSDYNVSSITINTSPDKENIFNVDEVVILLEKENIDKNNGIKIKKIDLRKEIPVGNTQSLLDDQKLLELVSAYIKLDKENIKITLKTEEDKYGGVN